MEWMLLVYHTIQRGVRLQQLLAPMSSTLYLHLQPILLPSQLIPTHNMTYPHVPAIPHVFYIPPTLTHSCTHTQTHTKRMHAHALHTLHNLHSQIVLLRLMHYIFVIVSVLPLNRFLASTFSILSAFLP